MSEELTKITLELLGKEYARVIDERGILEKKLKIAIDAINYSMKYYNGDKETTLIYWYCKEALEEIEKIK